MKKHIFALLALASISWTATGAIKARQVGTDTITVHVCSDITIANGVTTILEYQNSAYDSKTLEIADTTPGTACQVRVSHPSLGYVVNTSGFYFTSTTDTGDLQVDVYVEGVNTNTATATAYDIRNPITLATIYGGVIDYRLSGYKLFSTDL